MKVVTALVMQERAGFERPSTLLRNKGSFTNPGERVYAARAGGTRRARGRPASQPAGSRPLAGERRQPADRARHGQPALGDALRTRARANARGLRQPGRASEPPAAARLAGRGVHGEGLEPEADPARDRELGDLPPGLRREPGAAASAIPTTGCSRAARATGSRPRRCATWRSRPRACCSEKLGGPSVYPQQPDGVWNVPYSEMKWETSAGEDLHRRSLYTFYRRSSPYPSLVTFDAPSREMCTVRRVRTDTPLQALTTLNDPVFVEAARALAQRMAREGGTRAAERIAYGHRLCTARRPAEPDLDALVAFFGREKRALRGRRGGRAVRRGPARAGARERPSRESGRGGGPDDGRERAPEPRCHDHAGVRRVERAAPG